MAFTGTASNPVPFAQGQTADDRALLLKTFGGEVLTAYTAQTLMRGKVRERIITSGKSAQFPLTGTSKAEYMQRGQEALGNPFATHEREVTLDGLMASHHALNDLDVAMSHFDVRGPIAEDMGAALARADDTNAMRQVVLAARTAAVGEFPGGTVFTDNALTDVAGSVDGKAWLDFFRQAKIAMRKKKLPAGKPWYAVVPATVFDAIKYAQNTQGTYLMLDRNIGNPQGGLQSVFEYIDFEGIRIFTSELMPQTNDSANADVWSKYRADYSKTKGILWTPDAVARLQLLGVSVETERDARRQEDFLISTMAVGYGGLRVEGAFEFRIV